MEVDPSSSPGSSRPPPPPLAATPSYFDPESSGRREEYRRYRKRLSSNVSPLLGSSLSKSSGPRLVYDGESIPRRPNAGLLLEDIKPEAADYSNMESWDGSRRFSSAKMTSLDGGTSSNAAYSLGRLSVGKKLKPIKLEVTEFMCEPRERPTTSTMFARLFDSANQGHHELQAEEYNWLECWSDGCAIHRSTYVGKFLWKHWENPSFIGDGFL